MLHDGQYTEEEYTTRVGWGHSSIADTVAFARLADVGSLVLFHHDPMHSDAELETMLGRTRELWGGADEEVALAHEGMDLDLSATGG